MPTFAEYLLAVLSHCSLLRKDSPATTREVVRAISCPNISWGLTAVHLSVTQDLAMNSLSSSSAGGEWKTLPSHSGSAASKA